MNNELYHWKYIKREKVGGKWVYTYDKPSLKVTAADRSKYTQAEIDAAQKSYAIGKKNARQAAINDAANPKPAIRRNTDKLLSSTTTIKSGNTTVAKYDNVGKLERAAYGRKKDWAEAKNKVAKSLENDEYDSNDLLSSHHAVKEALSGDTVYNYKTRGKLERGVETAKEYLKDRLGFDEKEKYEKASSEASEALTKRTDAAEEAIDARSRDKERFDKAVDDYIDNSAKYRRAAIRSEKYKEAYYNTPIGKVAETKDRIDSAKEYVNTLFGKKRKK